MATVIEGAGRAEDVAPDITAERAAVRKVAKRLLPFLFFLYLLAYLDRVNVGFAKLEMNDLPWFSETVFGTGAGIFFIGYFLFEVPSNLILRKMGARRWIARIMISWGIVAMAMMFANSVPTFYALRFALGVAEAGFYPGVLLYLTYWFTPRQRARVVALFMTANSVAFIFGGPLSTWLMKMPPIFPGLNGWQQMFLLEGLPAFLMGFVVLATLPDGPRQAAWLTPEEREHIVNHVERGGGSGAASSSDKAHPPLWAALGRPEVALLCATFFCLVTGMYGISMWLPQIISNMGAKDDLVRVGLLTAIPYTVAGIVMVCNGFHSDRTNERKWHITIPAIVGAVGLIGSAVFASSPVLSLASLSVAAAGMWSTLGPFWSLPSKALAIRGGAALAGGIALVNAVGNLGGFLGPFAIGKVQEATTREGEPKNFFASLIALALCVTLGGILAQFAARKVEALDK